MLIYIKVDVMFWQRGDKVTRDLPSLYALNDVYLMLNNSNFVLLSV